MTKSICKVCRNTMGLSGTGTMTREPCSECGSVNVNLLISEKAIEDYKTKPVLEPEPKKVESPVVKEVQVVPEEVVQVAQAPNVVQAFESTDGNLWRTVEEAEVRDNEIVKDSITSDLQKLIPVGTKIKMDDITKVMEYIYER